MSGPKGLALLAVCLAAATTRGADGSAPRPPSPRPYSGGSLDLRVSGGGPCGAALPALENQTGRTLGGFAAVVFCEKPGDPPPAILSLTVDGADFAVDDDGNGALGKDETDAQASTPGTAARALAAREGVAPRQVFGLRITGRAPGPAVFRIAALSTSGALLAPPVASLASACDFAATADNRLAVLRFSLGGRNADAKRPVLGVTVVPPAGAVLKDVSSTGAPGAFDAKTATFTFRSPIAPGGDYFVEAVLDRPAQGRSTTVVWKAVYGPG